MRNRQRSLAGQASWLIVTILSAVMIALGGCGGLVSALPTPTPNVYYAANWQKGDDGWTFPQQSQWSAVSVSGAGVLESDGSASCCNFANIGILAPKSPPVSDYEVDADIRVVATNPAAKADQQYFGILVRGTREGGGYLVGIYNNAKPFPTVGVFASALTETGTDFHSSGVSYALDASKLHQYRVIVNGNKIDFSIDGSELLVPTPFPFTANPYSDAGYPGLVDSGYNIQVSSFIVKPAV